MSSCYRRTKVNMLFPPVVITTILLIQSDSEALNLSEETSCFILFAGWLDETKSCEAECRLLQQSRCGSTGEHLLDFRNFWIYRNMKRWRSREKDKRGMAVWSYFLWLHIMLVNSFLESFPSLSLSFLSNTASIWDISVYNLWWEKNWEKLFSFQANKVALLKVPLESPINMNYY